MCKFHERITIQRDGFFKPLFRKYKNKKVDKEKQSPRNGVSIPQTKPSCQVTFVWVPSSGIPSMTGISSSVLMLVAQNDNLAP